MEEDYPSAKPSRRDRRCRVCDADVEWPDRVCDSCSEREAEEWARYLDLACLMDDGPGVILEYKDGKALKTRIRPPTGKRGRSRRKHEI